MRPMHSLRRLLGIAGDVTPSSRAPAWSDVVVEAQGLLGGHAADPYLASGRCTPTWVWLNLLAHRPADEMSEVARLAVACEADRPVAALVWIVAHLLPAELEAVRREILVPAELDALGGGQPPERVEAVLRTVRRHVASHHRRRPPAPAS